MAYFKSNEKADGAGTQHQEEYYDESVYDDGLDEPYEEPEEEVLSAEEAEAQRKGRARFFMGAGNLFAVISGIILILLLLTLLFNMVYFVSNDLQQNFSLFQTKL